MDVRVSKTGSNAAEVSIAKSAAAPTTSSIGIMKQSRQRTDKQTALCLAKKTAKNRVNYCYPAIDKNTYRVQLIASCKRIFQRAL